MTKTLTEQWREGKLPAGCYYVLSTEDDTPVACDIDTVCDFMIRDVLAPVPSYEELQSYEKCADMLIDLNKKWEKTIKERKRLEKKLEIALEILGIIAMHSKDTVDAVQAACAISQIKEMEGVK